MYEKVGADICDELKREIDFTVKLRIEYNRKMASLGLLFNLFFPHEEEYKLICRFRSNVHAELCVNLHVRFLSNLT